jgi:hypothetical protein
MKPSDLYVGVIDFFSTLIPGGIAVLFVLNSAQGDTLRRWIFRQESSTENWVVFLVLAYVLGHLIAALGEAVLDPIYRRTYTQWRLATPKYAKSKLSPDASRWSVICARIGHVRNKTSPDNGLLATVKVLKRKQLDQIASQAGRTSDEITDPDDWAGTVVRMKSPTGTAEIEGTAAQAKLFRSLVVVMVLVACWPGLPSFLPIYAWVGVILIGVWRFMYLRWYATQRT